KLGRANVGSRPGCLGRAARRRIETSGALAARRFACVAVLAHGATMRTERDSMGDMQVPDEALYGASTQRAVLNFPISGRPMPPAFIHGLGLVKLACAQANEELGLLPRAK